MIETTENIKFHVSYSDLTNASITNVGSTFKVNWNDGAMVFWDHEGEPDIYNILQFHFHQPSEHTFDEKNYDLELHVVHSNYEQTELTVIGVFFDIDEGGNKDNEFIKSL